MRKIFFLSGLVFTTAYYKQCSLLWRSLSYSFLNLQFTYMIFRYSKSFVHQLLSKAWKIFLLKNSYSKSPKVVQVNLFALLPQRVGIRTWAKVVKKCLSPSLPIYLSKGPAIDCFAHLKPWICWLWLVKSICMICWHLQFRWSVHPAKYCNKNHACN